MHLPRTRRFISVVRRVGWTRQDGASCTTRPVDARLKHGKSVTESLFLNFRVSYSLVTSKFQRYSFRQLITLTVVTSRANFVDKPGASPAPNPKRPMNVTGRSGVHLSRKQASLPLESRSQTSLSYRTRESYLISLLVFAVSLPPAPRHRPTYAKTAL